MELELFEGNSLDVLGLIPDNTFDSIVTDPPYELGFMGKQWDASGIAYNTELWRHCLRVLKPGGYLLAFGGTRTYHRMAVAIEDAGFEIRDSIHWIYGSGFPKSHDVSKAIDKLLGAERSKIRVSADEVRNPKSINGGIGVEGGDRPWIQKALEVGYHEKDSDDPASVEAQQWDGWGTALKPAHEPVVVARKPLEKTVAHNVLKYGTGALNIDACRIPHQSEADREAATPQGRVTSNTRAGAAPDVDNEGRVETSRPDTTLGRWPTNIIHDGTPEIVGMFPNSKGGAYPAARGKAVNTSFASGQTTVGGARQMNDDGSAARYFAVTPYNEDDAQSFMYCAKASRSERNAGLEDLPEKPSGGMQGTIDKTLKTGSGNERNNMAQNFHPTVKPLALMRWLIRLVTPEGGRVLDPFAGSGTTLAAAILENRQPTGIELTAEYHPIIKKRCEWAAQQNTDIPTDHTDNTEQLQLFS